MPTEADGLTRLTEFAGNSIYAFQAVDAIIGAFCVILIWRRLGHLRFRTEAAQDELMGKLDDLLFAGDYEGATTLCDGDSRGVVQMAWLALTNRALGYAKVRKIVAERFQRDVIANLETLMIWVFTVIKSAPMLGLLGTVLGMMAAFGKLAGQQKVDATHLAGDISLALITTFVGLTIAIPLSMCVAAIQIRMRKMEDLSGSGLARFMESFKLALEQFGDGSDEDLGAEQQFEGGD